MMFNSIKCAALFFLFLRKKLKDVKQNLDLHHLFCVCTVLYPDTCLLQNMFFSSSCFPSCSVFLLHPDWVLHRGACVGRIRLEIRRYVRVYIRGWDFPITTHTHTQVIHAIYC